MANSLEKLFVKGEKAVGSPDLGCGQAFLLFCFIEVGVVPQTENDLHPSSDFSAVGTMRLSGV